jgi:peptide/nickel transport system substrate-binding protein
MLAEEWEFIDDTTLEVHLREDVVWHNGDPFSAEDVIFTFERMGQEEETERAVAYFETVSEFEQVDDYTVRIHTDDPDPLLAMRFAIRPAWIIPKDYFEEVGFDGFRFEPVGTGPYRVVSFEPDVALVTEANDEYYMERPNAVGVEMRMIPEVSARVAALISGEIDIATALPPDQRETVESADGVHAKSVVSLNFHMIRFNTHHPYLEDARIRRALCHSIDRELLVEALWFGEAHIPQGHQFPDFSEEMTFDEFELPYDPDLAQELMEEAGYDGEQLVLRVYPGYYTLYEDAAQAMLEMWAEVGFNVEIELTQEPWELEDDNIMHNWSNSSHMGDPAGSQWSNWGEGQSGQQWWDAPDEYNELGRQQARTLDEDERVEIWRRMNEIWMEERPGTPLYNQLETYGISDRVNYQPFGAIYMDLRNYNLSFND